MTPQPAEPVVAPETTATTSDSSDAAHIAAMGDDMAKIIVVTDATERADLIEALGWLNDTAKALRRKGYIGTAGNDYARQHARIDAMLTELESTP